MYIYMRIFVLHIHVYTFQTSDLQSKKIRLKQTRVILILVYRNTYILNKYIDRDQLQHLTTLSNKTINVRSLINHTFPDIKLPVCNIERITNEKSPYYQCNSCMQYGAL